MAETSQWMILLRTALSLGAVIALIYALAWAAKKYLRPERWANAGASDLKIIQSHSIDPKKKLMIVEARGEQLLLGVADSSISLLCHLPKTSEVKGL
jgi:flagellar biosynthetic protein FliO